MLKLHDGNYIEYVHIKANSAKFKTGDSVKKGDIICESGDIGFCPTPHVHLQVTDSAHDKAKTIPFAFIRSDNSKFIPIAGNSYSCEK
jgi:hypothetical protein